MSDSEVLAACILLSPIFYSIKFYFYMISFFLHSKKIKNLVKVENLSCKTAKQNYKKPVERRKNEFLLLVYPLNFSNYKIIT